jgi:hypothetical protein
MRNKERHDRGHAQEMQELIIRHICVEGWDYSGQGSGVNFRAFLERVGADLSAKYVAFKCADDYTESIDMPTTLHPQTILATRYAKVPITDLSAFPCGCAPLRNSTSRIRNGSPQSRRPMIRRESHHSNGITEHDSLQSTSATKSAKSRHRVRLARR